MIGLELAPDPYIETESLPDGVSKHEQEVSRMNACGIISSQLQRILIDWHSIADKRLYDTDPLDLICGKRHGLSTNELSSRLLAQLLFSPLHYTVRFSVCHLGERPKKLPTRRWRKGLLRLVPIFLRG